MERMRAGNRKQLIILEWPNIEKGRAQGYLRGWGRGVQDLMFECPLLNIQYIIMQNRDKTNKIRYLEQVVGCHLLSAVGVVGSRAAAPIPA